MRTSMPTCMLVTIFAVICTVRSMVSRDLAQMLANAEQARMDEYGQYPPGVPPSIDEIQQFKTSLKTLSELDHAMPNDDSAENALYDPNATEKIGAVVRKRPFCNGFTGCGRIGYGKRSVSDSILLNKLREPSQSQAEPEPLSIAKRPFCNGFFGCGNYGKRIVYRSRAGYRNRGSYVGKNEKRVFCNPGAFGCNNQGRSGYSYTPWIISIRSRLLSGFANDD